MKYASIPTKYNGVQFRSRLEARWAAFFDLCKWDWEYEPFDLNGWIPDFVLKGHKDILVEAKPMTIKNDPHYDDDYDYEFEWSEIITKIKKSGTDMDVLLLGNGMYKAEYKSKKAITHLGGILAYPHEEDSYIELAFLTNTIPKGIATYPTLIQADSFSYTPRRNMSIISDIPSLPFDTLDKFWKAAGNETQWEKP